MTTLYGISNCDTMKKAKKWLQDNGVEFQYHDYRKQGIDAGWLETVEADLGWEVLLNKRGTTYRQLDDSVKASLNSTTALKIMVEHPAIIKRPVLHHNGTFYCGFKPELYKEVFS